MNKELLLEEIKYVRNNMNEIKGILDRWIYVLEVQVKNDDFQKRINQHIKEQEQEK